MHTSEVQTFQIASKLFLLSAWLLSLPLFLPLLCSSALSAVALALEMVAVVCRRRGRRRRRCCCCCCCCCLCCCCCCCCLVSICAVVCGSGGGHCSYGSDICEGACCFCIVGHSDSFVGVGVLEPGIGTCVCAWGGASWRRHPGGCQRCPRGRCMLLFC